MGLNAGISTFSTFANNSYNFGSLGIKIGSDERARQYMFKNYVFEAYWLNIEVAIFFEIISHQPFRLLLLPVLIFPL